MILSMGVVKRMFGWLLAAVVIIVPAAFYRVFVLDAPKPVLRPPMMPPVVPNLAVDPLSIPDFVGGPEFDLYADETPLIEAAYQTAKSARQQVLAKRKAAAEKFSLGGLLVPVPAQAVTQSQVDEEYHQYRMEDVQAYQNLTTDDGGARESGERFLTAYVATATDSEDATDWMTVWKWGLAALEAGSRDPLVRTYCVHAQVQAGQGVEEVEPTLEEALPLLAQRKYPRRIVAWARVRLSELSRMSEHYLGNHRSLSGVPKERNRWPAATVAIVRWLEEEADRPERRRSLYRRFLDAWNAGNESDRRQLLVGCLQSPKVDAWLVHMLLGNREYDEGWNARGSALAAELSTHQRTGFQRHLARASIHLQYAWFLDPRLPQPAEKMIGVAMANADGERVPHEWFLRAIEGQFDYGGAYDARLHSLRPRWGGSLKEMLEFGKRCAETDRFNTIVPAFLPKTLEIIRDSELTSGQTLAKDTGAQALMRQFLARRDANRSRDKDQDLNIDQPNHRTWLALILQQCELPKEATVELLALDDRIDFSQMRMDGTAAAYEFCLAQAAQGEVRSQVLALAEKLHTAWDRDEPATAAVEAESLLQRLEPSATNAHAKRFYRHATVMLGQLREYSTGNWVPLSCESDLAGWEVFADTHSLDKETGGLTLSCREGGFARMHLRALAAFRPPFVVEADLELLNPPPFPRMAGFHMAPERMIHNPKRGTQHPLFGIGAGLSTKGQTNVIIRSDCAMHPFLDQQYYMAPYRLSTTGSHHVRVRLWDRAFELFVDHKSLPGILPFGLEPAGGLCIGEPQGHEVVRCRAEPAAGFRISNVRIRKIDAPQPLPETATADDKRTYWEQRVQLDDLDDFAHLQLARSRYLQQKYDEAAAHARRALALRPRVEGAHGLIGRVAYHTGRDREALEEFRLADTEREKDPNECAMRAEILATSSDETLRNGLQAREIFEFLQQYPDLERATYLSVLAAVHAELREFDKAVQLNAQAMEVSKEPDKPHLQQRHELYKSGKPYRREK